MKRILALLFALILLAGCSAAPEPVLEAQTSSAPASPEEIKPEPDRPAQPQPEPAEEPDVPEPAPVVIRNPLEESPNPRELDEPLPMPEEEPFYIYESDTQALAMKPDGTIVLQLPNVSLSLLYDLMTGEPIGLLAKTKGDYNWDGWGNIYDKRATSSLYDLNGRFLMNLPSQSISAYGQLLWCNLLVDENPRIYHYPSGQLLYTDVGGFEMIDDHVYFIHDNTVHFVSKDTEALFRLPESWSYQGILHDRYLSINTDEEHFLVDTTGEKFLSSTEGLITDVLNQDPLIYIWKLDGLYYLRDAKDQLILPGGYDCIEVLENGMIQTTSGNECQIIDLSTGEVLYTSYYGEMDLISGEYLVVPTEKASEKRLFTLDGVEVAGAGQGWDFIQIECYDQQGRPTLFSGRDWNIGDDFPTTTYFRPDETPVWSVCGFPRALTADTILMTDINNEGTFGKAWLIDRDTGALLFYAQKDDLRLNPIDYEELSGVIYEGRYVTLSFTEASGETCWYVIHESGNVVLENCRDLIYRGGGVVQCTKDGISGLLRLDGSWLYQEPQ